MPALSFNDLLALAAILVAGLAALYARWAAIQAKRSADAATRANAIAEYHHLRPLRLAAFHTMAAFASFCTKHKTFKLLHEIKGTQVLVREIMAFKIEMAKQGPLQIPDLERKAVEYERQGNQMQRLFDRIESGQGGSLDPAHSSAEDHLDAIVDWFAAERLDLDKRFEPYLVSPGAQPNRPRLI